MSHFSVTNSLAYMVCPISLLRTRWFLPMAASPVVNVSHSHSSETIIAASPSSAVHSLTSTVSGGHGLIAKYEKESGDARIEVYVEGKLSGPSPKKPAMCYHFFPNLTRIRAWSPGTTPMIPLTRRTGRSGTSRGSPAYVHS
jgi:hypothetical protein